jgi:hypothetical protein
VNEYGDVKNKFREVLGEPEKEPGEGDDDIANPPGPVF